MPRFEYKETYDIGASIFATSEHHTPFSVTVNADKVSADPAGKKAFPAGMFIDEIGTNEGRLLPRAITTAAFTAGSPTGGALGQMGPNAPAAKVNGYQLFVPGDELWLLAPSASVTFAGTWLANETITLTVGNDVLTFPAGDTVVANIAANAATALRNNAYFNRLVEALPIAGVLHLYHRDWRTVPALNATTNSAAGTATRSAATFAAPAKIGDIASINPATAGITLTGNAAISVPVGARVGAPTYRVLGIFAHSLDLLAAPRDIGVSTVGDIYEVSLPYIDDDIKRTLNKITFSSRF